MCYSHCMTDLVPFDFNNQRIRIFMIDGEPWFAVMDVCAAIGITSHRNASSRLNSDDVRTADAIDELGRKQIINVTCESGLYDLIFVSRKPEAKEFKRRVTKEILPEIRRSGMYLGGVTLQDALRRYANALDDKDRASRRAIAAETYAAELQPKAIEYDAFMDHDGTCSLGELAQAIGGGRTRLVARLRELGILVTENAAQGGTRPMQQYHERGWFTVAMEPTNIGPVAVTYVTPRGVSGVFRSLVRHGVGQRRWGALPDEETLFRILSFEDRTTA